MKRFFRLSAIALVLPSLLALTTPLKVKAANQFDICMEEMLSSGVDPEQASTGCGDALSPRDLSSCVQTITSNSAIKVEDALQNCFRVRRPVDLAQCVVNINDQILQSYANKASQKSNTPENTDTSSDNQDNMEMTDSSSPLMLALETCRASLLPARHSECVIGLSRSSNNSISPVKAMETCISAEDFPRDLFPSY